MVSVQDMAFETILLLKKASKSQPSIEFPIKQATHTALGSAVPNLSIKRTHYGGSRVFAPS